MLLVLFALVIAPFVNAGASVAGFSIKSGTGSKCEKMQKMDMSSQQSGFSCCDQNQNTDCKAHCQNLLLSHLPVSVLLESPAFQARSMRSVQLSSSQILKGVFPPLDPRPPQS
ncbi:hypothetical protein MNBD_GAMMA24-201 [hydrothermal vent metagenome]|uniref:Uncharacterized protein n=1 Tax=hydrothermal vent metagenome TaxID=652676 RepID=A0A3B1BKK6_9ZZZZ